MKKNLLFSGKIFLFFSVRNQTTSFRRAKPATTREIETEPNADRRLARFTASVERALCWHPDAKVAFIIMSRAATGDLSVRQPAPLMIQQQQQQREPILMMISSEQICASNSQSAAVFKEKFALFVVVVVVCWLVGCAKVQMRRVARLMEAFCFTFGNSNRSLWFVWILSAVTSVQLQ